MTISRSEAGAENVIRIVAAVVMNGEGKTLLVRKRGTKFFMQPGGKLAEGEAPITALQREIREELGCDLIAGSDRVLGSFSAPAANELGSVVEAEVFSVELAGEASPQAEIEEAIWLDPVAPVSLALAPLTERHVMPLARELARRSNVNSSAFSDMRQST